MSIQELQITANELITSADAFAQDIDTLLRTEEVFNEEIETIMMENKNLINELQSKVTIINI